MADDVESFSNMLRIGFGERLDARADSFLDMVAAAHFAGISGSRPRDSSRYILNGLRPHDCRRSTRQTPIPRAVVGEHLQARRES